MKKTILKFSHSALSREELKWIVGGTEENPGEGCPHCKDNQLYLCRFDIGSVCKCKVSGLGEGCETVIA